MKVAREREKRLSFWPVASLPLAEGYPTGARMHSQPAGLIARPAAVAHARECWPGHHGVGRRHGGIGRRHTVAIPRGHWGAVGEGAAHRRGVRNGRPPNLRRKRQSALPILPSLSLSLSFSPRSLVLPLPSISQRGRGEEERGGEEARAWQYTLDALAPMLSFFAEAKKIHRKSRPEERKGRGCKGETPPPNISESSSAHL